MAAVANIFKLDRSKNNAWLRSWTFLLCHLARYAELLEYHFRVATAVGVGVVITHVVQR